MPNTRSSTNAGTAAPRRSALRVGGRILLALPVASGLLLWASFFFPPLVWICLVPMALLIRLEGRRLWTYLGAWLGGLALFLPGTYWISYCAEWVWIGWLLLSAYLALYFPAFVLLARICNRRWGVPNLFAIPLVWIGLEYVRMHLLSGFGWLMLAHSVYRHESTIQIADVAGVYGVSFVIATFNAILVELLTLPIVARENGVPRFNPALQWRLAVAALIVCLNVGYGQFRVGQYRPREGPTCVVLQTNVPQDVRNFKSQEAYDRLKVLQAEAADYSGDVVIWPETTYPMPYGTTAPELSDLDVAERYLRRTTAPGYPLSEPPTAEIGRVFRHNLRVADDELEIWAAHVGKPVLAGSLFWDVRLPGARQTNASVLIVPGEGRVGRYDKIHLVPFGEYIPLSGAFSWALPYVAFLFPYPAGFNYDSDAGEEVRPIHFGKLHLAPLICFEDTVPDLTRAYLRKATPEAPVEILVNQSNDGWFNNSVEGRYHLAAAAFRCVESRRPMVRSSNTGPSGLIDSNGRIVRQFEKEGRTQGVEGWLRVEVPLDDRSAPYVVLGDWLPLAGLLMAGSLAAASFVRTALLFRREWRKNSPGSSENRATP